MSFLAGGRFRRAGGGGRGRGRGQSLPAVAHTTSDHPPLKNAGVLPAHGEEVGVTVGEADVGDVAAMALILVARCLRFRTGVLEEMDFAEVVSHSNHPLTVRATQGVYVCAI